MISGWEYQQRQEHDRLIRQELDRFDASEMDDHGIHWPTAHQKTMGSRWSRTGEWLPPLPVDQTVPEPNRPNSHIRQPIKVHLPEPQHGYKGSDEPRAYIGNVEFILPYAATRSSKYKYGKYHDKKITVRQLLKTKKGSRERRALIRFMIDEALVPCKEKYLYTLTKQASERGIESLQSKNNYQWGKYHENIGKQKEVEVVRNERCLGFNVGNVFFKEPENGKVYTKREALNWIAKTEKGSKERGAMIRFMIQKGYVLCKENCLYRLVRRTEMERLPVGSDDWGERGHPTNETASKKTIASEKLMKPNVKLSEMQLYQEPSRFHGALSSIRYDDRIFGRGVKGSAKLQNIGETMEINEPWAPSLPYCDRNGWKDCVQLFMIPVRFCDNVEKRLNAWGARKKIDICTYIGYNKDWLEYDQTCRTYRLYFPPTEFPPPINMNDGGNSLEFYNVKYHIRERCHVFCNGGKNERVFVCDRNKKGHAEPCCPFRFTVRWDKHGFYIFLLSNQKSPRNRGCPWHCCSGTNAG